MEEKGDGIIRQENVVDIMKQYLKASVRKLKLGCKWVFQIDNDPKHTSKVVAKWLKDNKVKALKWPSQRRQSHRTFVGRARRLQT